MKNMIEYYYNIRIDELYNKKDYYFFDISGNYYIFKPYSNSLDRSNDIYNINMFLNNMIRMDNIILNRYNKPTTNINNVNNNVVNTQSEIITNNVNTSNQELYDTTSNINNSQVVVKKKKSGVKINEDLKIILILGLVLFIFILLMPTIYDIFFK